MDRLIRLLRLLGPRRERLCALGALLLAMAAAGCAPKIGDKCVLSTDCSQQRGVVGSPGLSQRIGPRMCREVRRA